MANPQFKSVCQQLGITWRQLAEATGQPAATMRKRYHEGHVPRVPEADAIIRVLLARNRRVHALPASVIRRLWREP